MEGELFLGKDTDVKVMNKSDLNNVLKGIETTNKEVGLSAETVARKTSKFSLSSLW